MMPVLPRDARTPRPWVTPPRLRTLEGTSERHASWLELFFDMVFVVAIAQLAHELAGAGAFLLVSLVVAEITMQRAEAQAYPEGDS